MAGIIVDDNKLGGVPQSASRHVAMSTCFDVYSSIGGALSLIGFISSITIANTRTVTQIRHLNSVDAGIAVDTVVTPDAPTLAFNGFYVYGDKDSNPGLDNASNNAGTGPAGEITAASENEGFGPTIGRASGLQLMMTLDQQKVPFDIVVKHAYYSTALSSIAIIGAYKNCTVASMSVPINIGAAAIADTGNISVGYVAKAA